MCQSRHEQADAATTYATAQQCSASKLTQILAMQVHQHMFCARLDLAVDDHDGGKGLLVSEVGHCFSNISLKLCAFESALSCVHDPVVFNKLSVVVRVAAEQVMVRHT
jgi:hypothetical protein